MKVKDEEDHQAFWKSIECRMKKGEWISELRTKLKQAGACSFMKYHVESAFAATSTSNATTPPPSANKAPSEALERLRTQVKLCVIVWASAEDPSVFHKAYAKAFRKSIKKKKHKKRWKETPDVHIVRNGLIRMLQQAAFLLTPETTFARFLQDCIPLDCYSAQFQYLWEYFEVENPYEAPPPPNPLPEFKRSSTKPKRKLQEATSQTTTPSTAPSQSLLPNRVSLTTQIRKDNTLMSRSRFVGSHFNAGLTNMDVLFRQVTVVKKPKSVKKKLQTPPMTSVKKKLQTPPMIHPHSKDIVATAFRSLKRRRI